MHFKLVRLEIQMTWWSCIVQYYNTIGLYIIVTYNFAFWIILQWCLVLHDVVLLFQGLSNGNVNTACILTVRTYYLAHWSKHLPHLQTWSFPDQRHQLWFIYASFVSLSKLNTHSLNKGLWYCHRRIRYHLIQCLMTNTTCFEFDARVAFIHIFINSLCNIYVNYKGCMQHQTVCFYATTS